MAMLTQQELKMILVNVNYKRIILLSTKFCYFSRLRNTREICFDTVINLVTFITTKLNANEYGRLKEFTEMKNCKYNTIVQIHG